MTTIELGALIRQVRKQQGLTQQELAAVANVSTRFLHDLESGKSGVALGLVLQVLAALGVNLHCDVPELAP